MTDLRTALDPVLRDVRREIHTCFPAQVIAYDPTTSTVTVRPAMQRELNSGDVSEPVAYESLPDLYKVPVQWPRGGGFAVTFPLAPGDWVQVHCAEQSLLAWRRKGGTGVTPGLDDPHGLNGAVAVPGWYPDNEALTAPHATALEVRNEAGTVYVRLTDTGVVLGNATGADYVALAAKVDAWMEEIRDKFNAHTHTVSTTGTAESQTGTAAEVIGAQQISDEGGTGATLTRAS